jgi:hypothetical protein
MENRRGWVEPLESEALKTMRDQSGVKTPNFARRSHARFLLRVYRDMEREPSARPGIDAHSNTRLCTRGRALLFDLGELA